MTKLMQDIGWAAGRVYGHARLLTIDRDDPQGSAAVDARDDDEIEENPIVDEDDRLDDDDLDDQPRGKREDKSAKAYDGLKSERDRLQAENQKKDRLLQELTARVSTIEQGRESRESVNARADEESRTMDGLKRQLSSKLKALDRNDPEYSDKLVGLWTDHQADVARLASVETSNRVVEHRLTMDEQRERAHQSAVAELERQGLSKGDFKLLRAMASIKSEDDPGWDRRMPNDEQIPHLVGLLKEHLVKTTRQNPSFREEKAKHRSSMDGVIGEGSRSGERRSTRADREGTSELGSTLNDLSRLKRTQRKLADQMYASNRDR